MKYDLTDFPISICLYLNCWEEKYFQERGIGGIRLHLAEEGGYWADVDGLPGCYSQGETEQECLDNILEAIECHLGETYDNPRRTSR